MAAAALFFQVQEALAQCLCVFPLLPHIRVQPLRSCTGPRGRWRAVMPSTRFEALRIRLRAGDGLGRRLAAPDHLWISGQEMPTHRTRLTSSTKGLRAECPRVAAHGARGEGVWSAILRDVVVAAGRGPPEGELRSDVGGAPPSGRDRASSGSISFVEPATVSLLDRRRGHDDLLSSEAILESAASGLGKCLRFPLAACRNVRGETRPRDGTAHEVGEIAEPDSKATIRDGARRRPPAGAPPFSAGSGSVLVRRHAEHAGRRAVGVEREQARLGRRGSRDRSARASSPRSRGPPTRALGGRAPRPPASPSAGRRRTSRSGRREQKAHLVKTDVARCPRPAACASRRHHQLGERGSSSPPDSVRPPDRFDQLRSEEDRKALVCHARGRRAHVFVAGMAGQDRSGHQLERLATRRYPKLPLRSRRRKKPSCSPTKRRVAGPSRTGCRSPRLAPDSATASCCHHRKSTGFDDLVAAARPNGRIQPLHCGADRHKS